MATPDAEKRTPALFQVGFDFGNTFSKAVVRDLNTSRAWAHTFRNGGIMLPGCVVCDKGILRPHYSPAISYPPNGLWHIKRALALGAAWNDGMYSEPLARVYAETLGKNFRISPRGLIFAVAAFYLACALDDILEGVRKRISDFGARDYALVNMGVPDSADVAVYSRVLRLAWSLAHSPRFRATGMELESLAALLEETAAISCEDPALSVICNVYPESMARAQAFWRALRAPQAPGAIWLITDVGAVNIGQCAFSFSGYGETPQPDFYQSMECAHGSSEVERLIGAARPLGNPLEFWRRQKEGEDTFAEARKSAMQKAVACVRGDVERHSKKLYEAMVAGYRQENRKAEGLMLLRENLHFVFSGGGMLQAFYQEGVVDSFNNFVAGTPGACFTEMPSPPDLAMSANACRYSTWLATAYGLSFPFMDIQGTLPSRQ